MTRLEEIEAMMEAATPGPWKLNDAPGRPIVLTQYNEFISREINVARMDHSTMAAMPQRANARLIAAAPTIIKELVERVRVLENVAAWAREVVEDGEYDVKFECKDEAPIQSELLLNLERALSRLKEST